MSVMTKGPIVFMALVLLACAGVFIFTSEHVAAPAINIHESPQDAVYQEEAYKNRRMDIGTFIGVHISELSPVQESLGGKFYVTEVSAAKGSGVAKYEDGHRQYIADFSYTQSGDAGYTITKFKIRE